MKKILLSLLVFSSLFISCDDNLLEPFTPGSLTEEVAIKTSNDLYNLLNSSLNIMTNRTEYVFSSIFTDEAALGFNNGGQGRASEYIFLMNVSDGNAAVIWQQNYFALARLNRLIQFAPSIVAEDAVDQEIIDRAVAQAKILRALCHIKVLSYFSTDPKDDSALAGVLADRVITTDEKPSRSTNGVFYTAIHQDLNDAIEELTTNTAPAYPNATHYPNATLARALKARTFALKGDYVNAEFFADQVITTSGITLASNATEYNAVFHTHNEAPNKEVIFRLRRTAQQNAQGSNLNNGWNSLNNRVNGSPFYEVSRSLYNFLAANPDDYRTATIVHPTSLIDPNYMTSADVRNTDIICLQKHGGNFAASVSNSFNPDFIVARLSEMYLIKAEARAKALDYIGVQTQLQTIVNARYTAPITVALPGSEQAAWKAILDERRKELCFEGFRFIDLKRIGLQAGASLDRDPADYASSAWSLPGANPANLPLTSFKFALPIPQSELNANSGIQQNPGY